MPLITWKGVVHHRLSTQGSHNHLHPVGPGPGTPGCHRQAERPGGGPRSSCRSRCPLKGESCGDRQTGREEDSGGEHMSFESKGSSVWPSPFLLFTHEETEAWGSILPACNFLRGREVRGSESGKILWIQHCYAEVQRH